MSAYRGVFEDVIGINNSQKEMILKSSYRVSVCLKRYFTDVRALSYVIISRKKTVKWLEKKIRKLFDVHGNFVLTTRGHLLPPSERLGLLNADDIVEVIPNEIASQLQKQICVEATDSLDNVLDVGNENLTDECDSGANQKQKNSPERIFRQKDSSKQFEIEQIVMPNKEARELQNKIQCVQTVSNVYNGNMNDECDSEINQKQKYSLFGQKGSSKVFGLEQSVEDDTSSNSNTLNLSTDKVQDVLEKVKRNALTLLDNSYGICSQGTQSVYSTGGTRKRKRVRRKRQQVVLSPEMPKNYFEEDSFINNPDNGDKNNSVTVNSKSIPLVAILHNEEVCIRKPRIVQSIVEAT